jgi:glycine/serine hydroxymethyltransferase
VAFKIAGTAEFKERQERVLEGAKIIADRLNQSDVAEAGVSVLTGGTDVEALQARVDKLAADFPLYPQHEQW